MELQYTDDAGDFANRVPRTDWFLRPRRVAWLLGFLLLFGLMFLGLRRDPTAPDLGPLFATLPWVVGIPFVVFVAARFRRALWRRHRSSAPWVADGYPPGGGETRHVALTAPRVFARLRPVAAAAAVLAFVASALLSGDESEICGYAGLASLAFFVLTAWRGAAEVRVRLEEMPLRTGGPVRLTFTFLRMRRIPFDRLALTLRCVVETPRAGALLRPATRCAFGSTVRLGDELPVRSFSVDLVFEVPADGPSADPLGSPAVFWELAVDGDGPGFRYADSFLVPVYAVAARTS